MRTFYFSLFLLVGGGTRGAGDGIRVDVRAVDTQADYRGRLTQDSHSVNY
ncbi:putative k88 fimbrial protein A, partial [Escherichia coli P0304816.14]